MKYQMIQYLIAMFSYLLTFDNILFTAPEHPEHVIATLNKNSVIWEGKFETELPLYNSQDLKP